MKRVFLFLILFLIVFNSKAQQLSFSDSTKISLITCSPGEEVYEKFGHTAIRINDPKNKLDVVFNYGIFSFDTPNFYYKFIKGETDYQLGVYNTGNFLSSYAERNSIVWEQILNLNASEKQNLINLLLLNYQPENRTYRYNFVFDNCATRPRDKIIESLGGFVRFRGNSYPKTFRHWIGEYVGTDTWLKLGIDVVFGMDADRLATSGESMFLPEVLMSEFQPAQIVTLTGQTRKLVSDRKILVEKKQLKEPPSLGSIKPYTVSIILLILGSLLTIWDLYRRGHSKWIDSVLFILSGLGGLIVAYLMFFSTHPLVKTNLNILWLNPLNLIVGILIWKRKFGNILFFYQIFNILLLVGSLIAFAISAQFFNSAVFPLMILLLIRSTTSFAYLKNKLLKRRSIL